MQHLPEGDGRVSDVHRFWEQTGSFYSSGPSTLALPFMSPVDTSEWVREHAIDGFTGATPLALQKFEHLATDTLDLLAGSVAGSAGETSAILILGCGLYLAFRRMMDWRIPTGVLLGTVLTTLPFYLMNPEIYPTPQFMLLSGATISSKAVGRMINSSGQRMFPLIFRHMDELRKTIRGRSQTEQ